MIIEWNENISVNVEEFDNQHKKIFDIINELHDSFTKEDNIDIVNRAVDDMVKYTVIHFTKEEELLDKYNYPELDSHKEEHSLFINKIRQFKSDINRNERMVGVEAFAFLNNWWMHHIKVTDQKYSDFFNNQGIR